MEDHHHKPSTARVRGRPFPKGVSGNPGGRPKGSRNRTTLMAQAILDTSARVLVQKVVQLALQRETKCLHYCMERLIPRKKDAPIDFKPPELHDVSEIRKLFSSITAALDKGGITPSEAGTLVDMAETLQKLLEVTEIESRISALERASAARNDRRPGLR